MSNLKPSLTGISVSFLSFYLLKDLFVVVVVLVVALHAADTILLSRKGVNKGMKRMNSLPLSPVVISWATLNRKLRPSFLQILFNNVVPNSYSPFRAQQKGFGSRKTLTREANLCPNILSNSFILFLLNKNCVLPVVT